jgi:hypothetical protein
MESLFQDKSEGNHEKGRGIRLPVKSVEILKKCFESNPFPDKIEKEAFARKSHLTLQQVRFENITCMPSFPYSKTNNLFYIGYKLVLFRKEAPTSKRQTIIEFNSTF